MEGTKMGTQYTSSQPEDQQVTNNEKHSETLTNARKKVDAMLPILVSLKELRK